MRANTLGQIRYKPAQVPDDPKDIPRFLREEMEKISAAINLAIDGFDEVIYVAPPKPRAGMRRYADGTSWNPGSGAGLYRYSGSAWVFLG